MEGGRSGRSGVTGSEGGEERWKKRRFDGM